MATTIKDVIDTFEYFFHSLYRKEFTKTLPLNTYSERELLPLVRCYLLGVLRMMFPQKCRVHYPERCPVRGILISLLMMLPSSLLFVNLPLLAQLSRQP